MGRIKQAGFTLIELLMVVLLLAILAAVAIPQFIDFQVEAKDASTRGNLGALRTSVANQYAQMIVRCGSSAGEWPTAANMTANDITAGAGAPCTVADVPNAAERRFVPGSIGVNPWGEPPSAQVIDCRDGGDCVRGNAAACDGTANFSGGWCYDSQRGDIWADSQNSPNDEELF